MSSATRPVPGSAGVVAFPDRVEDAPPHDLDAERAFIGSLLCDPDRTLAAARTKGLSTEDFYSHALQTVWRVALDLHGRGIAPENRIIAGYFRDKGDKKTLELLEGINATLGHLYPLDWAERIREVAAKRGLWYFGREVSSLNGTAQESIARAREHLDFLSSAYKPSAERFAWTTGGAILAEPEEDESTHLWRRVVVPGAVTLLAGSPKAGKSWLLYAFASAVSRGDPWAGHPTTKVPVVLLSEEGRRTIRPKVRRFGAQEVIVIPRSGVPAGVSWEEVAAEAGEKCRREGAGCLIVDTFSHWADLAPDDEQKEGPIRRAMRPVQKVADELGIPVVVSHHLGHSGRIRGSTALQQVPDTLVTITAEDPEAPERQLAFKGRFEPEACVVRHIPNGDGPDTYAFLGSPKRARSQALYDAIGKHLLEQQSWVSGSEVREALGKRKADVLAALSEMAYAGRIQRLGAGPQARFASLDVARPA